MSFDRELQTCLGLVMQAEAPEPEYDALVFFRQWLAERNLGLVPIADAGTFEWPGHWIARVRVGLDDHAVVMFGSPSGALHDPSDALTRGGTIVEGWLVAPEAETPFVHVDSVRAVAGRGIEGDRYFDGRGTFSGTGRGYEVTLVEEWALVDVDLSWEQARRNIVTRGIALNTLVGRHFTVGTAECIGRRLAEPCAHLEKLARPGIIRPLVHRAGLRADILRDGEIALGDAIVPR